MTLILRPAIRSTLFVIIFRQMVDGSFIFHQIVDSLRQYIYTFLKCLWRFLQYLTTNDIYDDDRLIVCRLSVVTTTVLLFSVQMYNVHNMAKNGSAACTAVECTLCHDCQKMFNQQYHFQLLKLYAYILYIYMGNNRIVVITNDRRHTISLSSSALFCC